MNEPLVINGWAAAALATVLAEFVGPNGSFTDSVTIELVGIRWQVTANGSDGRTRRAHVGPQGDVEFVESFL